MLRYSRGVVGLVVVLAASTALAQPGGRGGFGGRGGGSFGSGGPSMTMSIYQVAMNAAVQEELGLSEEQKSKVRAIADDVRAKVEETASSRTGSREDFQSLSQEEREQRFQAMRERSREAAQKINQEFRPKLAEALDAIQVERLEQITVQANGARALLSPEVAGKLNLTEEQQKKIASALEFRAPGGTRGEGRGEGGRGGFDFSAMREARERQEQEAVAVLSTEQKAKFEDMKGAEFDVSQLRRGPGGEGRGFGGEGRGRGGEGRGGEGRGRGGEGRGRGEGRPNRPTTI